MISVLCEHPSRRQVTPCLDFRLTGHIFRLPVQELAIARDFGRRHIVLDEARLTEPPPDRLHRMIRDSFWNSLTRRIDSDGLEAICADPKNRSANQAPRIYVPEAEPEMIQYYMNVAETKPHLNLQVCTIPGHFDAAYVRSLNDEPGILALAMKKVTKSDGTPSLDGIPFVVPGARFNEVGFSSYFRDVSSADGPVRQPVGVAVQRKTPILLSREALADIRKSGTSSGTATVRYPEPFAFLVCTTDPSAYRHQVISLVSRLCQCAMPLF